MTRGANSANAVLQQPLRSRDVHEVIGQEGSGLDASRRSSKDKLCKLCIHVATESESRIFRSIDDSDKKQKI